LGYNLHNLILLEPKTERQLSDSNPTNLDLLEKFIKAKRIEGMSEKSLVFYKNYLLKLIEKVAKNVLDYTTDDFRNFLDDYQTNNRVSKVTLDNARRVFRSFFTWLAEEEYILKNPVSKIHKIKSDKIIKEVLTYDQLELLRDSAKDNIRNLAIIDLLISSGIRVGEIELLNRSDINFQEKQFKVFGKGSKERLAYFDSRTCLHLAQYLETRKDDNPALFVSIPINNNTFGRSPESIRFQKGGIETMIREIGKKAGIAKVHPHMFRRTMATHAIDKGVPIEQVKELLGHVNIETTMMYAMVDKENVKNTHRKYMGN
jgi:site-specific recombinase XerD